MSPFNWLRQRIADAVRGGIADALNDAAAGAEPSEPAVAALSAQMRAPRVLSWSDLTAGDPQIDLSEPINGKPARRAKS